MTRREFLAISCKMKVLAAEFLDEHADVNSCKILMQTKDGEAFEFATIRRDGGHIVEGGKPWRYRDPGQYYVCRRQRRRYSIRTVHERSDTIHEA